MLTMEDEVAEFYGQNETSVEGGFMGFVAISLIIMTMFSLIGNVLLFLLMSLASFSSTSYSVYLRSVAITDFISIFADSFRDIDDWLVYLFGHEKFIFYKHFETCLVFGTVYGVTSFCSIWLIVALAVDCYVCLRYPEKQTTWCTKQRAIHVVSAIAATGLILSLLIELTNIKNIINVYESHYRPCHMDWGEITLGFYVFINLILKQFLPISLIIIYSTKSVKLFTKIGSDQLSTLKTDIKGIYFKKTIIVLIAICIVSSILVSPYALCVLIEQIIMWIKGVDYNFQGTAHILLILCNILVNFTYFYKFYLLLIYSHVFRGEFLKFARLRHRSEYLIEEDCLENNTEMELQHRL